MPPETTIIESQSILDLLGLYPALLAAIAVLVGISSVIVRKNRYNAVVGIVLAAVACFGLGATAWRLFIYSGLLRLGSLVDPSQWRRSFGESWMAAGVVLPACGIGLLLLGLSVILTKTDKVKYIQDVEQAGADGAEEGV